MNEPNEIGFRDYQSVAIATIFSKFGIEPAGPENDEIVAACRRYRLRENGHDGPAGKTLAGGPNTSGESSPGA